jgi:hypothetical protein
MRWETSDNGRRRWRDLGDGGERLSQVILRPVTDEDRESGLQPFVDVPQTHPAYVVASLWIFQARRGQGHGKALLFRAARHLVDLHGDAWLGLMTDNYRQPSGRTRQNIRKCWESFLADLPAATVQDGFILLTSDLDLDG